MDEVASAEMASVSLAHDKATYSSHSGLQVPFCPVLVAGVEWGTRGGFPKRRQSVRLTGAAPARPVRFAGRLFDQEEHEVADGLASGAGAVGDAGCGAAGDDLG